MHSKKCSAYFEAELIIPDMFSIGALGRFLKGKVRARIQSIKPTP